MLYWLAGVAAWIGKELEERSRKSGSYGGGCDLLNDGGDATKCGESSVECWLI